MSMYAPERIVSFFRKVRPPVGSRPGTLVVSEEAPPPEIHVWEYDAAGAETRRIDDVEALAAYIDPERVTWIDVRGLGDEAVLRRIGEIFGLHPLALEDAVNVPQRAKSETFENHHLVIARIPLAEDDGRIDVPQVAFFIGGRTLITFQERYFGFFEPVRERLRAGQGPIWSAGPDYLAYALIDTLIDSYYPLAEELTEQLETLEDEVFEAPGSEVAGRIHKARRGLLVLRRVGRPQRQALRDLLVDPSPFVGHDVRVYLRDTFDHIAQIVELIDSSHEMAVGLMELNLSNLSQRANDVMVVLTLMASVFIPLTFIAGVYGMNFEFMPELHVRWAYPAILLLMVGVGGGMLLFFRRRGWIGRRSVRKD
jgi:magnesium transporter